jgi:RHS repeat-associated protein
MSLAYDRNGNVSSRNGMSQQWASFNLPTSLQKSGYQSQFSYGPDHRRWRQVATYQNGTETTHYGGDRLEKESTTSSGLTYWRHYVPTPSGDSIVVSRNSNASTSTTFVLADHLGSGDTLLDESGAVKSRLSYSTFGARRGSNWSATTAPDWLGIANLTRRGYTSHEMLDNVGIVHMNGRVYDPQLGRFLSTDPIIGNLRDSQPVNAYAYVGNRPLVTTDPSGLVPADGGIVSYPVVAAIFRTAVNFMGHHAALPPPPATALPGQSAQSGVGLCGPGTFSPTCGGVVLYAGVPGASGSPFNGGALPPEELYALENLQQFFVDLGINTVDVLILSPIRDAETAIGAARHGDFGTAAMYGGFAACGAVQICKAVRASSKAASRVRNSARRTLRASDVNTELVQRAMSRAELEATKATGLIRGGRSGVHYVSDAVNSRASRARERLALPTTPDVRVTLQVPRGTFSAPSVVGPLRLPDGKILTGGGLERTAVGDVPAAVIRVDDL